MAELKRYGNAGLQKLTELQQMKTTKGRFTREKESNKSKYQTRLCRKIYFATGGGGCQFDQPQAEMAKVHVQNVVVLDNPSPFFNPFQFEITFECIEDLKEDLEWKIIYVGSAESEAYDQVLDTVFVGPVPEGRHMFVFQADPPDPAKIPVADAVGVTVVLLTCSYRGQEFMRVGYYVNNEYSDPELKENPPAVPQFEKLNRNILATNPRVTRFKIDWDDQSSKVNGAAGKLDGSEKIVIEEATAESMEIS